MNRRFFNLLLFLTYFTFTLQAQITDNKVVGHLFDQTSKATIPGVYITVINKDSKNEVSRTSTDKDGTFSVSGLTPGVNYIIKASFVGYKILEYPFTFTQRITDLGKLYMKVESQVISEVVVKADLPAAVQNGDTVEVSADAFKTEPNASAEQLVTKMPGVVVENGTIKAQGEEVQKVMVDGKDFFNEDPALALKNLPADLIDKIQIFDKLSEQAQFTGFDDGSSVKTINIITKQSKQNSDFGKCYVGTDFYSKYIAGGNLNLFKNKRRITILGLFNNINQQNFSQQDLQGIASLSSTGKHDGGFIIGQQNGVNKISSLGLNYSDNFGKKITVDASYFYNSTQNSTTKFSKKDKFMYPRSDHFSDEYDTISSNKNNQRMNLRIEYNADSSNTFILIPKISFLNNRSTKYFSKLTTKNVNEFVNEEKLRSNTKREGYDFDNEFLLKHKFHKPKRTVTYSLKTSASENTPEYVQRGFIRKSLWDTIPGDQSANEISSAFKIASKLEYIEPISKISMLHFSLSNAYTKSKQDRDVYMPDELTNNLEYSDSLSNKYRTEYLNNHIGMDYRIKSNKIKFSIGTEYQYATLEGKQIYPLSQIDNKVFKNFLPSIEFTYKFNKRRNLKILYNTSTNSPNISQLSNAVDNSDITNLSAGNPGLTQEYTNTFTANYSFANPDKSNNYSIILKGEYTTNYIGNQTYTANQDTVFLYYNITLLKNMELSRPINLDYYKGVRLILNYGFPLRFMLSKLNLLAAGNYSRTPAYINFTLNRFTSYSATGGFVLSSDISQNIDFTVSYTANYTIVDNSIFTSESYVYPKYLYQEIGVRCNLIIWKGIFVQNEIHYQYDKGFENFNKSFTLWNAAVGKKLFKNQNGEIKLGVYDLLDQNMDISHAVTPQYIKDTKYNTLYRYFLLTLTYNFNSAPIQGGDVEDQKSKKQKGHKKDK